MRNSKLNRIITQLLGHTHQHLIEPYQQFIHDADAIYKALNTDIPLYYDATKLTEILWQYSTEKLWQYYKPRVIAQIKAFSDKNPNVVNYSNHELENYDHLSGNALSAYNYCESIYMPHSIMLQILNHHHQEIAKLNLRANPDSDSAYKAFEAKNCNLLNEYHYYSEFCHKLKKLLKQPFNCALQERMRLFGLLQSNFIRHISECSNYNSLSVSHRPLYYISESVLNELDKYRIQQINLYDCMLHKIGSNAPASLSSSLTILVLSNNHFTMFPDIISSLSQIRYLYFFNNPLSYSETPITSGSLERIFIESNKRKYLPFGLKRYGYYHHSPYTIRFPEIDVVTSAATMLLNIIAAGVSYRLYGSTWPLLFLAGLTLQLYCSLVITSAEKHVNDIICRLDDLQIQPEELLDNVIPTDSIKCLKGGYQLATKGSFLPYFNRYAATGGYLYEHAKDTQDEQLMNAFKRLGLD